METGKFYAYIGADRNKKTFDQYMCQIIRTVDTGKKDLRDNLGDLFHKVAYFYENGIKEVFIINYEIGLPFATWEKSLRMIKERYPDLTLHYTTEALQCCWVADEIIYCGVNSMSDIARDRIKYGNVLDGLGTGLLNEKPND